jgi:uncharacterized repeat protein (TIGR03803 family)
MKSSNSLLTLALTCAAITFGLAVCAQAQTLTYLAAFNGTNGAGPYASMVQATDGNFYGAAGLATSKGGSEIFRVTPTGEISTVYSFCSLPNCADGQGPLTPILGSDGNLYGVTSSTVFKLTLDGKLTTLHTFHCLGSSCPEGALPMGIVEASDGNFYGTTNEGGTGAPFPDGTLFRISPSGQFKVLYSFCSQTNCTDGGSPLAPPIQGRDGNFYGTGFDGGTSGGGVLYQLTPAGAYKVLENFCYDGLNCHNNGWPTRLVQDAKGNFFGTTAWAGSYNSGSVFEFTPTKRLILLHNFVYSGQEDAATGATLANDGNLYGVAANNNWDDQNGYGSIFEVTPAGGFTPFDSFYNLNGANAATYLQNGPLLQGTDGNFYGATAFGQNSNSGEGYGTIFRFSNGLSPLVKTVPVAGKVGKRILILGNGLTGTTSVTFNGVAGEFTVESDTFIRATVPSGATTGPVSVVTPSGTLNSNPQFVVTR